MTTQAPILGVIRMLLNHNIRAHLRQLFSTPIWLRIDRWDARENTVGLIGPIYDHEEQTDENGRPIKMRDYKHVRSPENLEEFRKHVNPFSIQYSLFRNYNIS